MANENALWDRSDDANPYAPPRATLDVEPVELIPTTGFAAAEAIRKAHIRHEASVKSIGLLHYIGASLCLLGAGACVITELFGLLPAGRMGSLATVVAVLFYLTIGGLHLALGIGLRRLQSWARWAEVGLVSLVLAFYGIVAIVGLVGGGDTAGLSGLFVGILFVYTILGYILYLLLAAKAKTIFSAEYKSVIAQTPHIRYRTSLVVKIALALVVVLIVLALIAAFTGRSN